MAILRSARKNKITFTEDGELPAGAEVVNLISREPSVEPEAIGSESDSDEAPEEESTAKAKAELLAKSKAEQDLQREALKAAKEKRKQRDLLFKKQQEAKRERETKKQETERLKFEQDKLEASAQADILPELLPKELLGILDTTQGKGGAKHIRTEELESQHAAKRKRMKLEKLQALKQKSAVKKGPVYVQVQEFGSSKSRVPHAEQSILDIKNLWMQRESLNKKA